MCVVERERETNWSRNRLIYLSQCKIQSKSEALVGSVAFLLGATPNAIVIAPWTYAALPTLLPPFTEIRPIDEKGWLSA